MLSAYPRNHHDYLKGEGRCGADYKDSNMLPNSTLAERVAFKLPILQNAEEDITRYSYEFLPFKHDHYLALETAAGPICVTLRRTTNKALIMIRTSSGSTYSQINLEKLPKQHWFRRLLRRRWPTANDALMAMGHPLASVPFFHVNGRELSGKLLKMDERMIIGSHKVGVVFAGSGQSNFNQTLSNSVEGVSQQFWRFLRFLGQQIDLRDWGGFNGGLDTCNNLTGKSSFYTKWQQLEFIFHASPLIPIFHPDDSEQIERKRHIGNDIVLIVFRDPDAPKFNLSSINSKQIHVVLIVTPSTLDYDFEFSVEFYRQKGMPDIPIFQENEKGTFSVAIPQDRNMFLATLVLAERTSYKAADFATLLNKARSCLLKSIIEGYLDK